MNNGNIIIALIVGSVVGFVVGKTTNKPTAANTPIVAPAPAQPSAPTAGGNRPTEDDKTVYRVPLRDAATKGSSSAKVTIVTYSDFQCPFCSRVVPTMAEIEKTYGDQVRIAFKHNPLPFHSDAPLASEAALAAGEQGKFFEMHDKLFANQQNIQRADLEKYAGELGLNMSQFTAALDSHKFQAQIDRDKQEAATFGARGTPSFFINGRKLRGAQPFPAFKALIDQEIAKADAALKAGASAEGLYEELTKNGLTEAAAPPAQPSQPQRAPEPPAGSKVSIVSDLAGSPARGAKDPKVTVVLWSDFQCPFCSRAAPTEKEMVEKYPNDLRFVFKHQPLPFHPNAKPAAIASMAAHNQGKFWEMHDLLFANNKELSDAKYQEFAKQLGLNMDKFNKDLADPAIAAKVEADAAYGSKVGADGTPTFYINGREMAGAMPFESFKGIIDDEIKKANDLLAKGTPKAGLYDAILKYNSENAPKAPAAPAEPGDDGKPVKIDIGQSPTRGASGAKVSIVEWSDYQCPFCSRVTPTIDQLLKDYEGKVKFTFKNQPLPFHDNALPAAKAALAAGKQGKYWQMYDVLFKNNTALDGASIEKYASELGLNVAKFKADMDSSEIKAQIDKDMADGNGVGANGTPTFFINGRKLVGAQPIDAFKKMIDEELAKK